MTINFIPNDPLAISSIPMRPYAPRPDRSTAKAHIKVAGAVDEDKYAVGSPEFLYWQCREGALAAIEAWEEIHGPFSSWHEKKELAVFPDEGEDLNAYYDRKRGSQPERTSFYHQEVGSATHFSGASTDVVAHEAGHAFLDAIRPDFWDSFRFEVNSFHEAFGDCVAIITALHDKESRRKILSKVDATNAVESTAEDLANAIKKAFPGHNAGAPRRARNDFQWGPMGSLPDDGGPGELIFEEHSFGQVFSGCFYDTIVNIFSGLSSQSEANLLKATQTAGKLLVKGVQQAPQRSQYFREVGRFMILADEEDNAGANHAAIRDAFQRHNIALGSSLTLAPQAAFAAAATTARRGVAAGRAAMSARTLGAAAKRGLASLIGATSNKLDVTPVNVFGRKLHQAVHERVVALDAVHQKLKGVVATAAQVAFIGQSHGALSVMGPVSDPNVTDKDVECYVGSLVKHARIAFESASTRRSARSMVASSRLKTLGQCTHEVREHRGKKTLVRVRFACPG